MIVYKHFIRLSDMARKAGLGTKNSLDLLLSRQQSDAGSQEPDASAQDVIQQDQAFYRSIAIDLIQPSPYQPRRSMDESALNELAQSIRSQGVLQPLMVRPVDGGAYYELVAGERRWRAAQLAQLGTVPAIVQSIEDEGAMAIALIENIQRQDLNAMEEAQALQRLSEEFEMTHQAIAEAVGKSRTGVSNALRLLALHPDVQNLLAENKIEVGHAKVLLGLDEDEQPEIARIVVLKGLTVRETESLVKSYHQPQKNKQPKQKDSNIQALETNLSERLGAKVAIKHKADGRGQLQIHYHDLDQLDEILAQYFEINSEQAD